MGHTQAGTIQSIYFEYPDFGSEVLKVYHVYSVKHMHALRSILGVLVSLGKLPL